MIVAIHQPHYLPWLRYMDKIARSNVFVLLDDAQYTKNGWQNRNKIKTAQGQMYLTVPARAAFAKSINEVRIHNQERWRAKHWTALLTNYARAPFFKLYRGTLETVYQRDWETLCALNVHLLGLLCGALDIQTRIICSSELGVLGHGTERLVDICSALRATSYLTGDYAAGNHLDANLFRKRGIEVQLQAWQCPKYRQQHTHVDFIPDLSVVDLLFNEGGRSRGVLGLGHPEMSALPLAT